MQVITTEQQIIEFFPRPPILTSLNAGWSGMNLAYMCQPAFAVPEVCTSRWHSIAIFTHGSRIIHADRKLDGRFKRDSVRGGDMVIHPANVGQKACWDAEGDFIMVAIETTAFACAIDEAGQQTQLLPHFATPDPLIYQIGLALKGMLQSGINNRLYAETMANALIVHLLQHYSTRTQIKEYTGGLSKSKLQQVIEYINDHLEQDLSLTELGAIAQMSPHYFCRLFKQSTGMSPHQYVIQTRVNCAKELLLQGIGIAEVAYRVGFANQSHLNRHFKKLVGVTPAAVKGLI